MFPLVASLVVLVALVLMIGGVRLVGLGRRRQGLLMILAALVILANLVILMTPVTPR